MSGLLDPGTAMNVTRMALYLYWPDGSSSLVTGADLRVDAGFAYEGQTVDVQAVPELAGYRSSVIELRVYPKQDMRGQGFLTVTRRPPIPGE